MTDLEKAGLIGNESEQKQEGLSKDEFITRIDQALAAFMFAVQALTERVSQCELYISYLLHKDPEVRDKIKAMAEVKTGPENEREAK